MNGFLSLFLASCCALHIHRHRHAHTQVVIGMSWLLPIHAFLTSVKVCKRSHTHTIRNIVSRHRGGGGGVTGNSATGAHVKPRGPLECIYINTYIYTIYTEHMCYCIYRPRKSGNVQMCVRRRAGATRFANIQPEGHHRSLSCAELPLLLLLLSSLLSTIATRSVAFPPS